MVTVTVGEPKTQEKEYEPFGDEWKAEMKKNNKDFIIEMCRKALIESKRLQTILDGIDFPSL